MRPWVQTPVLSKKKKKNNGKINKKKSEQNGLELWLKW
jgi:hypothetical protein